MILRTGTLKETVLDRSVYKRLGPAQKQRIRKDGCDAGAPAVLMSSSGISMNTRHAAALSVLHAVNSLAARRAVPEQIETCILLPENTEEQALRDIEEQIRDAALLTGVFVSGGHTEVTSAVTRPVISTVCSGRPAALCSRNSKGAAAAAGPDIVITKWIGLEGTWLLACGKEELRSRFPAGFLYRAEKAGEYLSILKDCEIVMRTDPAAEMVSAGTGGIFAALWKLSSMTGAGFDIDIHQIPVLQETIEIADYFGLDAYEMGSLGSLVIAAADGRALAASLEAEGIHAAVAGKLTPEREMRIRNGDEIRNLNMPSPDALLKIFG